ncbi:MAG: NAD-dependent dehydratase [Candidatus Rokubacteria bacterium RBG_16_73_20]|nr:MAG: NAD-dependent dehydratase [Candidatus Rokubacteria bacterium GWC2_70_16]OGK97276.1 MAG: NAD-dependent dehydratase [Candidatus Rokubacteria bacterium RBG_16_73_20]
MRVFVAGGAGFIGSHLVDHLLAVPGAAVTVFDNFSSGQRWHLEAHAGDPRLTVVAGDLQDRAALSAALAGHERVYHVASNPDIARAMTQPDIDFWQGTYLTQNLLEAMRVAGVRRLVYASGSGVYGETGLKAVHEDWAPLLPISTYGASKLACEALLSAYCHMFDFQAWAFRFANVVGRRQTHGVAYDFIRKLRRDPRQLEILGDGSQSKSYIHVSDVVAAIQHAVSRAAAPFNYYNVATEDALDVRTIAGMVFDAMGLRDVALRFTGGDRGWRGDVPVLRFDLTKIHTLGWRARLGSREAMQRAIREMLEDPS